MKTTFLLIAGLIVFLIGAAYLIAKIGARNARLHDEYMRCYEKIQKVLDYEICEQNCEWIERLFIRLDKCTYKNHEMRQVLDNEFKEKYNIWINANKEVI